MGDDDVVAECTDVPYLLAERRLVPCVLLEADVDRVKVVVAVDERPDTGCPK
ncbi:MAG: hypothetical protein ACRD6W_00665 [Nitrososphaerales archaeon]